MGDTPTDELEQEHYGTKVIRFAMIGITGGGKSATGNSIAALDADTLSTWEEAKKKGNKFKQEIKKKWHKLQGQPEGKPFVSRADSESVTQEPCRKDFVLFGQKICVVDTPGFVDTKCSEEKIVEDILTSMYMLTPGPHAIVMVVNAGRQTPEAINTVKRMKDIFGPDIVNFLIIVFTGMDNVTRDGQDIDEYVQKLKTSSTTTIFKDLLQQAGNRYIGFDNTLSPFSEENEVQVQKLVKMARNIAKRNNDRCYSNELLKHTYKSLRDTELLEVQKERDEERMKSAHALQLKETELLNAKYYQEKLEKQHEVLTALLKEQMNKPAPAAAAPVIIRESSPQPAQKGGCFASSATVLTKDADGQVYQKALKDLKVGDLVESYDPDAKAVVFSSVYFITYQDDDKTVSTLRRLHYEDKDGKAKFLAIHPKHLVYANVLSTPISNNTMQHQIPSHPVISEEVRLGDILWVKDASCDQLKPRQVLEVDEVSANVRHPLTFNHYIVVDGVLASVHMYDERLLRRVTTPLRLVYKMNPKFSNAPFTKKVVKLWDAVENYL